MSDDAPRLGVHKNMTEAVYRAAPGLNISLLRAMAHSPAHCRQEQIAPQESTEAQVIGQAFHAALLEPNVFYGAYYRAPSVDRRSREGRAQWTEAAAANPGRTAVKADTFDWIEAACERLWMASDVKALLGGPGGVNELSAFWEWEVGGRSVRAKGRIDRLTQLESAAAVIVDCKTVPYGAAASGAFAREIARWNYHAQAAYYTDGLERIAPRRRGWLWLVVEKEAPFAHAIYEPLPEVISAGRALYEGWLARYMACAEANDWPGYESGVQPIDLPSWAYRDLEGF